MNEPVIAPESEPLEPDWMRVAFRATLGELRSFATTLGEVLLRPRAFGAAWLGGATPALNPVAFLGTALALTQPFLVRLIPYFYSGIDEQSNVWRVYQAVSVYLGFLLVAFVSHPILRLAGSRRRLRSTVAMSMYAGAIPSLLAVPVVAGLVLLGSQPGGAFSFSLSSIMTVLYFVFGFLPFVGTLRGLHRVSWPVIALSLLLGCVVADRTIERALAPALERAFHVQFPQPRAPAKLP